MTVLGKYGMGDVPRASLGGSSSTQKPGSDGGGFEARHLQISAEVGSAHARIDRDDTEGRSRDHRFDSHLQEQLGASVGHPTLMYGTEQTCLGSEVPVGIVVCIFIVRPRQYRPFVLNGFGDRFGRSPRVDF